MSKKTKSTNGKIDLQTLVERAKEAGQFARDINSFQYFYHDGNNAYLWNAKGFDEVRLDVPMLMTFLQVYDFVINPCEVIPVWLNILAGIHEVDVADIVDYFTKQGYIQPISLGEGSTAQCGIH